MSAFVDALRENPRRPYLLDNAAPEIAALVDAVSLLVLRCDGDEGVRADGSNIDTLAVHAALARLDGKARGASVPDESEGRGEVKP